MTPRDPHAQEAVLLRRQLAAAERDAEHRANALTELADRYARLRRVAIRRQATVDGLRADRAFWGRFPAARIMAPRSTCFPSPEDRV